VKEDGLRICGMTIPSPIPVEPKPPPRMNFAIRRSLVQRAGDDRSAAIESLPARVQAQGTSAAFDRNQCTSQRGHLYIVRLRRNFVPCGAPAPSVRRRSRNVTIRSSLKRLPHSNLPRRIGLISRRIACKRCIRPLK